MINLLSISGFFNSIGKIILYSLIAVAVVFVLVLLLKNTSTRRITLYALSAIIIVVGVISCFKIQSTLDIKSQEVGTAIYIEEKQDYDVISTFDIGSMSFEAEDYETYKNISSFKPETFNGTDKDYKMLINDRPADKNNVYAGKIESEFVFNFYNTDDSVLSTAKINIVVEYLAKETRVTTIMKNENSSVSYFDSFMEINGLVIKVVER